jgi:hypothetical protein
MTATLTPPAAGRRAAYDRDGFVVACGLFDPADMRDAAEADRLLIGCDYLKSVRNLRCRWQNNVFTGDCTFENLGGRSGIDLRTLQDLADHSTPELTARYSHRRLYDLSGAVGKLPNLVPTDRTDAVGIPLHITGADAAGVVTGGAERHQSASTGDLRVVGAGKGRATKTLEMQGAGASRHRPALIGTSEDDGTRTRNHRIDRPVPNHLDGRRK